MSDHMSEAFAAGLRTALVHTVDPTRSGRRRLRWQRIGPGLAVLTLITGGTAYAAGMLSGPPGGEAVGAVASSVTVSGTGTQRVTLGPPPAIANSIEIQFTCLTAGTFSFPDGASVGCDQSEVDPQTVTATWQLPVSSGQTATTITAGTGQRWRLTATYATATPIPWAVNAHGHTYGVANGRGMPDLIAAIATNGKNGYVYARQLNGPMPTSPRQALAMQATTQPRVISVYESDGTTVTGQIVIGTTGTKTMASPPAA